jgi:hypothetical protein
MQIPAGRVRTTLPGQPTTSLQGKGTCIPRTLNSITFMLAPATAAQQLSKTVGGLRAKESHARLQMPESHTPSTSSLGTAPADMLPVFGGSHILQTAVPTDREAPIHLLYVLNCHGCGN